jgi:hypothetical protein
MSFVATAQDVYNADDLAKFIDIPESFRGKMVRIVPDGAVMKQTNLTLLNKQKQIITKRIDGE